MLNRITRTETKHSAVRITNGARNFTHAEATLQY